MSWITIQPTIRYPRVYRLLRRSGHTAQKALEILFDAKRGSEFALQWIRQLRVQHHSNLLETGGPHEQS
jgi:hypothetical protein